MFSQMGVPTKKTPYEVSEASDVVITMLPNSAHVSMAISSKRHSPTCESITSFVASISFIVLQQFLIV